MEVAIELQDLEVRFDDTVALAALNLTVHRGVSLAVVGTNGSGKSTLLETLAQLHKPTKGSVSVLGEAPSLVPQSTEVAESVPITVRDVVRLARYPQVGLFRRFSDADNTAVTRSLERMQVGDLADRALHELSGGQRQRVLVAQGLAQDSPVLLLDEPMTGLDVPSRRLVLEVIAEETAAGRTVIMTTHSLADAAQSDLVLLLKTTPVAFGSPTDVLTEENLRATFGHRITELGDGLAVDDFHEH